MNEREKVTGKEVEAEGVSQRKGSEGLSETLGETLKALKQGVMVSSLLSKQKRWEKR